MSAPVSDPSQSGARGAPVKGPWALGRRIGDIWQGLGTNGAAPGTSGERRKAFLYGWAALALIVGAVNVINVVTILHEQPQDGVAGPIVWEGSSWLTFVLFDWIAWLALVLVPPLSRPRWRVPLVHGAALVLFSFCHVAGFLALRKAVYWANGETYSFGAFGSHFLYELTKDTLGYMLAVTAFALARFVVEKSGAPAAAPGAAYYSIRDGNRILRVPVADILAVSSAGNYVEFSLRDGRKPLMRSPLSALETELAPHGFVRTHRSWLVNAMQMTELKPEGSGDYTVELGALSVPLSRRFPEALAKLRAG
jgi:LytTr DNA-binding domain-containing protein